MNSELIPERPNQEGVERDDSPYVLESSLDSLTAALIADRQSQTGALLSKRIDRAGYVVPDLTGVGDESAKVQAAVDLAYAQGWPLVFPAGTYTMGEITIPGEVMRISGAGANWGGTILKPAPGAEFIIRTRTGAILRDLAFHLDGVETVAIDITNTSRALIDNIYIYGSSTRDSERAGVGIHLWGTSASNSAHANRIQNVMIVRCRRGIWGRSYCYDTEALNLWVALCSEQGIRLNDGGHMFTNIHVWECDSHGLYLIACGGSRFVNMYLEHNKGYGLFSGSYDVFGATFVGVRLWRNELGGARTQYGKRDRFIGCDIQENNGVGLNFYNHTDAIVQGCVFYDERPTKTQAYGIVSAGDSDRIIVMGCNAPDDHHVNFGIRLVGTSNQVLGNIT
ncbi:right-handed parallel beta-helix repeat-containing protein [Leucobacter tenebrionis]|uniref:right-handed parallel beta-helix repeat-containing protein n=1 Tax=Leucobacter tenebrionis TaxID=2873270 RepID=UPI001CA780B8|nr:right-handed parallel beta-helix repeat-containing protein [Leucobacter tenebrionis]QZY53063.1 right-handed parallel beta-helix repeat-containing protein [Leucobacter tenebrionis]